MKYAIKPLRVALTNFLVAVLVFFSAQYLYWQVFPYQTAEIAVPMEVLNENNEVPNGGELVMFLMIDKQSEYTPVVSRNVICDDGSVHFVESTVTGGTARPQGIYDVTVRFTIADNMPVGATCEFEFQNDYKVNPIRTITKKWRSEPFRITE